MTTDEELKLARKAIAELLNAEEWPESLRAATHDELVNAMLDTDEAVPEQVRWTAQIILEARRFLEVTDRWPLNDLNGPALARAGAENSNEETDSQNGN